MLLAQRSNFMTFHNPQLRPATQLTGTYIQYIQPTSSASAILMLAEISDGFTQKDVRGNTMEIPQHSRAVPSIYKAA